MLRLVVKDAWRFIWRQKLFSSLVIVTLALGLGANTAVYGILDSVLFSPLPFESPESLVVVWSRATEEGGQKEGVGTHEFRDWREGSSAFEDVAAVRYQGYSLVESGDPTELLAAEVTANFFDLLGVLPARGQSFTRQAIEAGDEKVVLLAHTLWQSRFGSDPDLVGRQLRLEGEPHTVLGVMPPDFNFPNDDVELWAPMHIGAAGSQARNLHLVGRLSEGVTVDLARTDMDRLSTRLAEENPAYYGGRGALVIPIQEQLVGHLEPVLFVLTGSVLAILAIGCVNTANLFLARTLARREELLVRTALGAGRGRIFLQLLVESLALALLAGFVGVGVSYLVARTLVRLSPVDLPARVAVDLDLGSLAFVLGLALLAGLAVGALPAAQGSRQSLATGLRSGGRGSKGGRGSLARQAFVVAQVAISLLLLIGAGLMIRSVIELGQVEAGWNPDPLLGAQIYLSEQDYAEGHQQIALTDRLLDELRNMPGVVSASLSTSLPGTEVGIDFALPISLPGQESDPSWRASLRAVAPDYFRTLGVPLLRGRDFTSSDNLDSRQVVIVNEALVRRFLSHRPEAVGDWLTIPFRGRRDWEIVGVVGNIRHQGLDKGARPELYLPFAQAPFRGFGLAVKTEADPDSLAPALRSAVWSIDGQQPISWLGSMRGVVADSFGDRRFVMILLTSLGVIALLLTALGIYGVISFTVERRIPEIGVRMALGARPREVSRAIMGQAMGLAIAGLGIGVVGALFAARWLESFLFGVSSVDPLVFFVSTALLVAVAALATVLPAWRATRIDPATALRAN